MWEMVTDLAGDEGHLRPAGRLEEGAVDHAPDLDGVRGDGDYVGEHANHVRRHGVPLHWKKEEIERMLVEVA